MRIIIATICLLLVSCSITPEQKPFVVVWNIGQGQWVTVVTNSTCLHFDMGGEHRLPPVLNYCRDKLNRVYLSHSDMDHIKFLPWGVRHLRRLCDAAPPKDPMNRAKKAIVGRVPLCHSGLSTNEVHVIEITPPLNQLKKRKKKGANEFSRVFIVYGPDSSILIPGDSTADAEAIWANSLASLPPVRILVAGHHGSRTSTSDFLLDRLPMLKIAIASARKARYGHPHPEVIARLWAHHVPLLRTEIWGNIALPL